MTTHRAEITIAAPAEQVWDILADFGGVWRYNPSVETSASLTEANRGVGAERRCDLTLAGATVEERIVDWVEGESYDVELYGGKKMPPIRDALAHLQVREEDGVTVASGTFSYTPKFGPVGRLMDRLMLSKQFAKAWSGIFAGLKHHAETGELVERGTKLDYAGVGRVTA